MSLLRLGRGSIVELQGWEPSPTGGVHKALPAFPALAARPTLPPPVARVLELEATPDGLPVASYHAQLVEKLGSHPGVQVRREGTISFDDGTVGWVLELAVAPIANAGTIQLHALREDGGCIHHLVATTSESLWPSLVKELTSLLRSYVPAH